ncbi:hypothetical protein [Kribbella sp. NPDC051770]|uniref:hypothetical protein n=1 Tax=Kribbella sp. NPDC051770 TaxID=3155413 RepID=UPI003424B6F1
MNDDFDEELRAALRPDDQLRPLDPAAVIAGAHHRRRMRGLAAAGLASVAVLAVAAGGLLSFGSPSGSAPAGPPTVGPPSGVPSGRATVRPSDTPSAKVTPDAKFIDQCWSALQAEDPRPGPAAKRKATLTNLRGTLVIFAGSNYWGACDNGYGDEVSLRQVTSTQRPSRADVDAFAVANNQVIEGGKPYEYSWAAGMLPQGVFGVRYRFPEGDVKDATIAGNYWLMQNRASVPSQHDGPDSPRIKVDLLGANEQVLTTHELVWGKHTCAQISHGC